MEENKLMQLLEFGQVIWLDYLSRSFLQSGELHRYIGLGLRGITSNPSIFSDAIQNEGVYDGDIETLSRLGYSPRMIYEVLAVEDIRQAADVLYPIYERTGGGDGFVSLEVNPHLAHDTNGSIAEAERLFRAVDRPNVMIKIPATTEGLPAITTLTASGVNVNVTLMFSQSQYDLVVEAYLTGLEKRLEEGRPLDDIASVASIFVSRTDVKVDQMLEDIDSLQARELQGKIGIANAQIIYQQFKEKFAGARWERLLEAGGRLQRVLFGSTSTKNPNYSDTLYPDHLIGPDTVNTLPPETLEAFMEHGTVAPTLEQEVPAARQQLETLAELGIDMGHVTRELLDEGVNKFAEPFDELLDAIGVQHPEGLVA